MITTCPVLFLCLTDEEAAEISALLASLNSEGGNDVKRQNAYAQAVGAVAVRQLQSLQNSEATRTDDHARTDDPATATYGGVSFDGIFINMGILVMLLLWKGVLLALAVCTPIHLAMFVISRWKPDFFNIPRSPRSRAKKARESVARRPDLTNVVQWRGPRESGQ